MVLSFFLVLLLGFLLFPRTVFNTSVEKYSRTQVYYCCKQSDASRRATYARVTAWTTDPRPLIHAAEACQISSPSSGSQPGCQKLLRSRRGWGRRNVRPRITLFSASQVLFIATTTIATAEQDTSAETQAAATFTIRGSDSLECGVF